VDEPDVGNRDRLAPLDNVVATLVILNARREEKRLDYSMTPVIPLRHENSNIHT